MAPQMARRIKITQPTVLAEFVGLLICLVWEFTDVIVCKGFSWLLRSWLVVGGGVSVSWLKLDFLPVFVLVTTVDWTFEFTGEASSSLL
jgi:hypothetical protein